jgi:hypothetical protein
MLIDGKRRYAVQVFRYRDEEGDKCLPIMTKSLGRLTLEGAWKLRYVELRSRDLDTHTVQIVDLEDGSQF